MDTSTPRILTARERDVLTAMLSVESIGVEELRIQAGDAMVYGSADGGDPTIYLTPERSGGVYHQANGAVVDTGEGVVLWTSDGRLHSLEYIGITDHGPSEFPDPSTMRVTVPDLS